MKNKKLQRIGLRTAAFAAAAALVMTGCGSNSSNYAASEPAYEMKAESAAMADFAADGLYDAEVPEEYMGSGATANESGSVQAETPKDTSRKLITTINMSAETDDLDSVLAFVEKRVAALDGYIERSDISNGSYRTYSDRTRRERNASMTIRIPAANLAGFVTEVQERTNITSQSRNVEDVTLTYADLDSHKRMLKAEEQRLLGFMENAETIEDMIAVEERLTNVQYQIDSMESQLRTYDNRINYSTVYLNIEEVVEFTITPEAPRTMWEEIAIGFSENLDSVITGLKNFFVWIVIHIPQLIVWAIVIAVIVVIVRAVRKNSKKKVDASGMTARERRKQEKLAKKAAARNGGAVPPANPAGGSNYIAPGTSAGSDPTSGSGPSGS